MTAPATHQGPPYDLILFDCDSTLCRMEGLDRLAERAGLAEQLRPLTEAAMNGEIDFEQAYADRLARLQPDLDSVNWLGGEYCDQIVTGAVELIHALHERGKQVHVLSGGIHQALLPLAGVLDIPSERLHAVNLLFDEAGNYRDYDRTSPLTRQHGKAAACSEMIGDGSHAVLIGDGVTDLEAAAAGVDFIGFGGVVRRPAVESRAALYYPHADLFGLLSWLLTADEL
ncbi:MAG: HAD-IB family phosphatase [Gammaproteobacteria bacterium]|nr:HAD-IB family phosphatase [Gammaproteobacteria bacterium]